LDEEIFHARRVRRIGTVGIHDTADIAPPAAQILRTLHQSLWNAVGRGRRALMLSARFACFFASYAEPAKDGFGHSDGQRKNSVRLVSQPTDPMKTTAKITAACITLVLAAAVGSAAPVAENWENHCAKCHGEDGKGQTKAGKKLNVKDYTEAKAQAEMKDDDMLKAIVDGVFDKAGKEKMKAYKEELSAAESKELVAYIRKFKG
jgi:mono/diheme cytochrome c family protein